MQRTHLPGFIVKAVAVSGWLFLALALLSFHTTDWPSHEVYPYGPVLNLCGPVGAWLAYWCQVTIGAGVYPVLALTGVGLVLWMAKGRVSDLWLRAIGVALLAVSFAAAVHHLSPARPGGGGFPEGQGGVLGIMTSAFLQSHFASAGTRLLLATTFIVGLLLAADDLVLRAPKLAGAAVAAARGRTTSGDAASDAPAGESWVDRAVKALPSLPALQLPVWRRGTDGGVAEEADDAVSLKRPVLLNRHNLTDDEVDLTWANDGPAVSADAAVVDDVDAGPSAAAVIPPAAAATEAVSGVTAPINNGQAARAVEDDEEEADEPVVAKTPPPAEPSEVVVRSAATAKAKIPTAPPPPLRELGDYQMPGWEMLADAETGFAESQERFVREKAVILEQTLRDFGVDARVVSIDTGPVITMYEIALPTGTKVASITQLTNDIARSMKAISVRIVAPVPGKDTVGIEIPNATKEKVRFKELMQLAPDATEKMTIPLYLGKDASGEALVTDLCAMPHCLIAGTTGSGKSVCINTIILSIIYQQRPDMVKLILIDPKVVEMAPFKDIPHLMCPVINDCGRATSVLDWACQKMDERYELLAEAGVRHLSAYNKLSQEELIERFKPSSPEEEARIPKKLPYIVIVIDELADLMMQSGKEVESFIVRLAQKSRAVGIHLILATQRPQANVVTGLIKSNMPSRIAFRVASRMDSRIVLDQNGADLLLGQGDMLFLPNGANKPIRAQGTFIDDLEIRGSVKQVRQAAEAQYEPELVQIKALRSDSEFEHDDLYDDAVRVVLETRRGSVSLLQRRLSIGYARASRLIERMAATGIVGDYKGSQSREANLTLEEWENARSQTAKDAADGMTV